MIMSGVSLTLWFQISPLSEILLKGGGVVRNQIMDSHIPKNPSQNPKSTRKFLLQGRRIVWEGDSNPQSELVLAPPLTNACFIRGKQRRQSWEFPRQTVGKRTAI
jgi:hypothetical protein